VRSVQSCLAPLARGSGAGAQLAQHLGDLGSCLRPRQGSHGGAHLLQAWLILAR